MNHSFLQSLNKETAFLRRAEGERGLSSGDDWDLAVMSPENVEASLYKAFGAPLIEARHRYVRRFFYDWGGVDLLPRFAWNGWPYLEEERFWKNAVLKEDEVRIPCVSHDAFIAWFCGLLHGGNYKERYDELIYRAASEEKEEFFECLIWAFGRDWADELIAMALARHPKGALAHVDELRKELKWQTFCRNGLFAISPVVDHWLGELKNHMKPPFPWIAFLGPDGSGKSTVIDGIKENLLKSRIEMRHIHWRPTVRKPIPDEPGLPVTDPHGRAKRNTLLSVAALGLLFVRWWLGYIMRLLHLRAKAKVILSDRYYLDLLVDQQRYLYGGPVWLAKLLFRFFPKPELTFVLLTDADTIFGRKTEVGKKELERQLITYRELAKSLGDRAKVIDVGRPVEVVIADVLAKVKENFYERTRKRKGGSK